MKVFGDFFPRQIFGRMHALCANVRCLWAACIIILLAWFWPFKQPHVVIVDQVASPVPLLRWFLPRGARILFYCHFPDLLLAPRAPPSSGHLPSLRSMYRAPLDFVEESATGAAHAVLVNSHYTAGVFADTFRRLHARGLRPKVLYPAVDVTAFADAAAAAGPMRGGRAVLGRSASSDVVGIPAGARVFLSINRFERKKNVALALKVTTASTLAHALSSDTGLFPYDLMMMGGRSAAP